MKPAPFDYVKPNSVEEVFDLLDQYRDEARLLAGGQSLIPSLNMRLSAPAILIDITGLDALHGIVVGPAFCGSERLPPIRSSRHRRRLHVPQSRNLPGHPCAYRKSDSAILVVKATENWV